MYNTPSLNDVFEIKNELKKLHIEPFLHMPRYYKNAKKQIFSWKKIIYTIKILCFTAIDWKKCFITSDILNFPLIFPMKIFVSLHFCNVWAYMRKVLYVVS